MTKTEQIAKDNDEFRSKMSGLGRVKGRIVTTPGVFSLSIPTTMQKVMQFNGFTPDNDPYGEHDFGVIEINGQKVFWKIDYYDKDYHMGSPDPTNLEETRRVLTVMLAEEY